MRPAVEYLREPLSLPPDAPTPLGVDEVGRGPGAGPVVACAARFRPGVGPDDLPAGLTDSKKLTPARRTAIADRLPGLVAFAFGAASARAIDRDGIRAATQGAMADAVSRLDPGGHAPVLVDGRDVPAPLAGRAHALPRADGRALEVAAASVLAKVLRDRLMADLAARHPVYGWERNAGYLVPAHISSVKTHGRTGHHRTTFLRRLGKR